MLSIGLKDSDGPWGRAAGTRLGKVPTCRGHPGVLLYNLSERAVCQLSIVNKARCAAKGEMLRVAPQRTGRGKGNAIYLPDEHNY